MRFVYLLAILLVLASMVVAQSVGHVSPNRGKSATNWSSLPPEAQSTILSALEGGGPGWAEQVEQTASDGQAEDGLGGSVAVSGNTIVVGAPSHPYSASDQGPGVAYVFFQGGGRWRQQAQLTASDGVAGDGFGGSVAVDGNTIVVGAPLHPVGSNQSPGQGAAYVFVESGGKWRQEAELIASDGASWDHFGNSVAVSGSTIVVGAVYHKAQGINEPGLGTAYVFVGDGGTWSQQAELTASDGFSDDLFGVSVGISGSTAIVGASRHTVGMNVNQGAAYVFAASAGTWRQQAELTAGEGAAYDYFGAAVAISDDTAVVGAPLQGAAYVFGGFGTTWSEQSQLTAPDGTQNSQFGTSVAVSGSTAVVGANGQTIGSNMGEGAAYVFVQSGGTWRPQAELTGSDGAKLDSFGMSVGVSNGAAVVGAPAHKVGSNLAQGAAYVFGSPGVKLSPPLLRFGGQAINTTSEAKTVVLKNSGNGTLTMSSIALALGANFAIASNTCGGTLPANRTCRVSVTFTPTQVGALSDTVNFTDNASGSPQTLPVLGTGAAGPATVTPSSLNFNGVGLDLSSPALTVWLANNLPTTLTGISFSATAPFGIDRRRGCTATLGPHETCLILVTFTPEQLGAATGALTVSDSASNSPQTVSLSGFGVGAAAIVPSSLTFPTTEVGETSGAKLADLHSHAGRLLDISISTTGPFAMASTTCGTTLGRGDGCTMHVTFTPTQSGPATGTVTVTDSDGTQTVSLSGTGTTQLVYPSPASANFGNQAVGTTSGPIEIELYNKGGQQITVTSVSASGDFMVTENTCTNGVKPNTHCWVGVVFSPTQSGALSGTLRFVDSASNSPQTASLSGTGD